VAVSTVIEVKTIYAHIDRCCVKLVIVSDVICMCTNFFCS